MQFECKPDSAIIDYTNSPNFTSKPYIERREHSFLFITSFKIIFRLFSASYIEEEGSTCDLAQIKCENVYNSKFGDFFKNDSKFIGSYGTKLVLDHPLVS